MYRLRIIRVTLTGSRGFLKPCVNFTNNNLAEPSSHLKLGEGMPSAHWRATNPVTLGRGWHFGNLKNKAYMS